MRTSKSAAIQPGFVIKTLLFDDLDSDPEYSHEVM